MISSLKKIINPDQATAIQGIGCSGFVRHAVGAFFYFVFGVIKKYLVKAIFTS